MSVFKLIVGGKCVCGHSGKGPLCTCERDERYTFSFRYRGKQYTRRTDATSEAAALELEAAFLKGLRGERCDEVLAFLNGDDSRMRRIYSSVGEVMEAYRSKWHVWLKSEGAALRNLSDLALVCAHALDLWIVNEGGRKGVKVGVKVPDLERIGALSCGRLNRDLVAAYFLARQKAAGIATNEVTEWSAAPQHASWNSTLDHACDVFNSTAREHALVGLRLPDLTEFVKARRLPEAEALPQPFSPEEFGVLCATFDSLRESDPDLWLLNVVSRQTGMRPGTVMVMRGSWLVEGEGGRWFIDVLAQSNDRIGKKHGALNQFVPVTEALRVEIAARGQGQTVGGGLSKSAQAVLQKRHNALIKQTVGGEGSHGQGAYRFRDTVAASLACVRGVEAVRKLLGDTCTIWDYEGVLPQVSEKMQSELRAWLEEG